jgi:hypothetical protein
VPLIARVLGRLRLQGGLQHRFLVSWFNSPSGPIRSRLSVLACSSNCAADSWVSLVCFATGSSVSVKINSFRQAITFGVSTEVQIHR